MTNEQIVIRIQMGIDVADNMLQLWEQNKRFIHIMALKFQGKAELEDLEQEGYLALYDAVDGFKPEYGYTFLTYAGGWIKRRMQQYVLNNSVLHIPAYKSEKLREYHKIINSFYVTEGRKPTRHEIAWNMGISVDMVAELERLADIIKIGSLDRSLTEEEDGATVGDMIPAAGDFETDILEDVQQGQLRRILWPLVDSLPDEQGQVLRQRFQEGKTLKATGNSLGLSMEQVRQMEAKAMRSLRCSRKRRILESFLEDEMAYSKGVTGTGVKCFERTWTSSTERAALHRLGK